MLLRPRLEAQRGHILLPLRRNCSVDACQYVSRSKLAGQSQARLEDGCFLDSRYAVGAKSPGRVRDKIPGGALGDETERVNRSFHTLAAGLTISDHQGAIARYGVLNEWQRGEVLRLALSAGRIDVEPLPHRHRPLTQRAGHGS